MSPAAQKEKILILEGDGGFGDKIVQGLAKRGYETILVNKGADAFKSIVDNLPHLILLDITLQGADPYDILAKKQAEPMLAKIPLFLLSTQGLPINMRQVPAGSVKEFLMAMQSNPEDVVLKVDHHFGHDAAVPAPVPAGDKKKVLWVEDDKLIGTILAKKLVASGFDLFHAKSGEEAVESLRQIMPDVIVLDLLLPGMNGFDILQFLKGETRFARVPILILSNLSKQSDMERARLLGARKFLVKAAVSLDQIVAEIWALCGK